MKKPFVTLQLTKAEAYLLTSLYHHLESDYALGLANAVVPTDYRQRLRGIVEKMVGPMDRESVLPTPTPTLENATRLTPNDYKDAFAVQDASNLPGVLRTFAEIMPRIIEETRVTGEAYNTHPIAVLFADKIAGLAQTYSRYNEAYETITAKLNSLV